MFIPLNLSISPLKSQVKNYLYYNLTHQFIQSVCFRFKYTINQIYLYRF